MPDDMPQQDSADRRTQLAADRTVFAAERTKVTKRGVRSSPPMETM